MNRYVLLVVSVLSVLFASPASAGWTPPVVVGPPISTPYQDYSAFVTQDNRTMYLASDRPGTTGQRDLWIAEKVGEAWQNPVNLGPAVNSTYDEHDPMVDESGTILFFTSSRPSPYGGNWPWHLYWSRKVSGVWQPAEDMGVPINSSFGEECPFLFVTHRDTFFYFASYGRSGGQGQWDVWISHRSNGQWEPPVNPGYPVNTGYLDAAPCLTKHLGGGVTQAYSGDLLRIYFTSMRPGGSGHIDLWRAMRIEGLWQNPENLGPTVNWGYRSDRPCFIDDDFKNEDALLYFSDDGRSGGIGSWDIWITRQEEDPPSASSLPKGDAGIDLNAYPNPFSSETWVQYLAPHGRPFSVIVYDPTGRRVRTLDSGQGDGRLHRISWDGRSASGASLPNGLFWVKIASGPLTRTCRLLLFR